MYELMWVLIQTIIVVYLFFLRRTDFQEYEEILFKPSEHILYLGVFHPTISRPHRELTDSKIIHDYINKPGGEQ